MRNLRERFFAFCRSYPGAEEIDALPFSEAQRALGLRRADFLFENRSIICEIKTLEQDPAHKLEKVMAEHGIHPSHLSAGRHVVEELFKTLPKGENLYRRTVKLLTRTIDKGLADATNQIRETKSLLEIQSADGLVIILNDDVVLLGHIFFEERLRLALQKRTSHGTHYHQDITYVLLVIEATGVTAPDGGTWAVNAYYDNPPVLEQHGLRSFIHRFMEAWARENGQEFATTDEDHDLHRLMRDSKLIVDIE